LTAGTAGTVVTWATRLTTQERNREIMCPRKKKFAATRQSKKVNLNSTTKWSHMSKGFIGRTAPATL